MLETPRLCFVCSSLLLALSGCSAASSQDGPPDPGLDGGLADASFQPKDGGLATIPPRVFLVHGASALPQGILDFRVCPSGDDAPARPSDNRIPRANYPGVAAGGFAEIKTGGTWTAPFALDAYGLGAAEKTVPLPCSMLTSNFYNKAPLPSLQAIPRPGVLAVVGGGADGGANAQVLAIEVAITAAVPAFQIAVASPGLVSSFSLATTGRLVVSFGPLDGKCESTGLHDGPATLGETLRSPMPFPAPSSGFDGNGVKVCAAPMNGTPMFLFQQSFVDLQRASVPESVPQDFYDQQALFVLVLVGEKGAQDPAHDLHAVLIPFSVTK